MNSPESHPIGDLVGAFLEAAESVFRSADPEVHEAIPAELTYELDQIVSSYLDAYGIVPSAFQSIQQEVVNSLAKDLSDDSPLSPNSVLFDDHGNVDLSDLFGYLGQHQGLIFHGFMDHGSASDPIDVSA